MAVLSGVKMYLGLILLMKTYSALSVVIRGWDGVDGALQVWMTLPFEEALPD